jgi:excisionase family DNA binding protein
MKTHKEIGRSDEAQRLIDKREAAALLGISPRTVEREASAGRLAKYRIRGCVRFLKADVLRLAGIMNTNPLLT